MQFVLIHFSKSPLRRKANRQLCHSLGSKPATPPNSFYHLLCLSLLICKSEACSFAGCYDEVLQAGWLTAEIFSLVVWGLDVQVQGEGRAGSFRGLRENLFQASGVVRATCRSSLASRSITLITAFVLHGTWYLRTCLVWVQMSPLYKDIAMMEQGPL